MALSQRPHTPGKMLGRSIQIYRRNFWLFVGIGVVPVAAAVSALAASAPISNPVSGDQSDVGGAAVTLAAYRTRLEALDRLIIACQQAPGLANCKSGEVGPDALVMLGSAAGEKARPVRFGWLRDLLDQATKPEKNDKASAANYVTAGAPPATLAERIAEARSRLREDWERAGQASQPGTARPEASLDAQRRTLGQILAVKEYQTAVAKPTLMDRILRKVGRWISNALSSLVEAGSKNKWIGLAAEIVFVILICVGLVWFLIRLERQGQFWAAGTHARPEASAASARDWQLWLRDAKGAADHGAWRDAIHLLYWASISRLESGGLWPADRARTPREYLSLLSVESEQRSTLSALTRSFERTWYAGQAAGEGDFERAEELAGKLGAR